MSDFPDLEAELKQLRPRPVSRDLVSRVETSLAEQTTSTPTAGVLPKRPKFRVSWFALSLGTAAAAAVVVLAILSVDPAPRSSQTTIAANTPPATQTPVQQYAQLNGSFVPDGLTRVVYHTEDEGLVYPAADQAPVRRVRSRARETLHWKEPSTGASLRVSYPTEEVRLIPVGVQ